MKIIRDERLKHRLVGLAVIVSILAIFAPALLKQSNQHLEFRPVSAKLPTKPALPEVNIPDEKESFKRMKLAHIELPELEAKPEAIGEGFKAEEKGAHSKIESIALESSVALENPLPLEDKELNQPALEPTTHEATHTELSLEHPVKVEEKPILESEALKVVPKTSVKKNVVKRASLPQKKINTSRIEAYFLQVGTFTQRKNANLLVTKLKTKGYSAFYKSLATRNGVVYKVFIGKPRPMLEAQKLKQQVARSLKINGFVVSTREIS